MKNRVLGKAVLEKYYWFFNIRSIKANKRKNKYRFRKGSTYFQHATESFDRQFTIEQSLREPLLFYRQLIPQNIKNIILNYLIEFNLSTDLITKFPQKVSGGQLQRLNIIRSLSTTRYIGL